VAVRFIKDPEAVLDFSIDWTSELAPGDRLIHVSVIPDPGLRVISSNVTDKIATAWLQGGIPGNTYNVVFHVTTEGGRQDDRTIQILIKEL
jgi:hypothetical protein